jgi:hypothetical protein
MHDHPKNDHDHDHDHDHEVEAPGWAFIDAHLAKLYPGQLPHQYASQTAFEPQSLSPLPAIAVYEAPRARVAGQWRPAHWHYVGYGLSELFEKLSDDPEISGFGFELTLRVPKRDHEDLPPTWGVRFLQALGRYVLLSRDGFDSGHRADLGGPLVPDLPTQLSAIACVPDPTLGKVHGPFGSLLFLQVIGLHADELAEIVDMDRERVVMMLSELDPDGLTDLTRESFLRGPRGAPTIRRYRHGLGLV